jgi:hypothetical protein
MSFGGPASIAFERGHGSNTCRPDLIALPTGQAHRCIDIPFLGIPFSAGVHLPKSQRASTRMTSRAPSMPAYNRKAERLKRQSSAPEVLRLSPAGVIAATAAYNRIADATFFRLCGSILA